MLWAFRCLRRFDLVQGTNRHCARRLLSIGFQRPDFLEITLAWLAGDGSFRQNGQALSANAPQRRWSRLADDHGIRVAALRW
jgi:hypothetical protein